MHGPFPALSACHLQLVIIPSKLKALRHDCVASSSRSMARAGGSHLQGTRVTSFGLNRRWANAEISPYLGVPDKYSSPASRFGRPDQTFPILLGRG